MDPGTEKLGIQKMLRFNRQSFRNALCVLVATFYTQPLTIAIATEPPVVPYETVQFEELDSLAPSSGQEQKLAELERQISELRAMVDRPTLPVVPPVTSTPKYPETKLTGFFQADFGLIHQDPANMAFVGDAEDGADFRRARLAAAGKVAENVAFIVEMDFAFPGRPSFMDVWLEVQKRPLLGNVRVGQYRQPFGMDGLTSVRELTFLERALPFAFLPFRQIGVMASDQAFDGLATWAISGFRFPTDFFGSALGDDGGYGFASRLTALPFYHENHYLLHIGGAYSFLDPSNDLVQYRSTPEYFTSETGGGVPGGVPIQFPFFVDTGLVATDHVNLFGTELAWVAGSLHGQAEWIVANVSQPNGQTVSFTGASAQAAYLLTGEVRPYNKAAGVLGRIIPDCPFGQGGLGAIEAAIRYSYLDLDDRQIQGGKLNDITAGLNWYLNQYTKFQLNYIHAFLNPPGLPTNDADIVAMRAQVDF